MNKNWKIRLVWLGLIVLVVILFIDIKRTADEKDARRIQEEKTPYPTYFLVDELYCIHKPGCAALKYGTDELHRVIFIKEDDPELSTFSWFCPSCISISDYEHIRSLQK